NVRDRSEVLTHGRCRSSRGTKTVWAGVQADEAALCRNLTCNRKSHKNPVRGGPAPPLCQGRSLSPLGEGGGRRAVRRQVASSRERFAGIGSSRLARSSVDTQSAQDEARNQRLVAWTDAILDALTIPSHAPTRP